MASTKKRNKKYIPRAAVLPICYAVPRAAMLTLDLMPHACIAAFAAGVACEENAYTLANCTNIAALLALNYPVVVQACAKAGQDAIIRVIQRGESGRWGFSGDDYTDIKAAVTLFDELQGASTRRQLRDAIAFLHKSM